MTLRIILMEWLRLRKMFIRKWRERIRTRWSKDWFDFRIRSILVIMIWSILLKIFLGKSWSGLLWSKIIWLEIKMSRWKNLRRLRRLIKRWENQGNSTNILYLLFLLKKMLLWIPNFLLTRFRLNLKSL